MKRISLALLCALVALSLFGATNLPGGDVPVTSVPSTGCQYGALIFKTTTPTGHYQCVGGHYVAIAGSAGVTSINIVAPSGMSASGGPVTASGSITLSWTSQAQGLFLASPCSGSGAAVFRALCVGDIPSLAPSKITGTAVITTDPRLSDSRTPTAHAAAHASAGSDPVTLAESQVTSLTTDLAARELAANKDIAGGYAGLNGSGKILGSEIIYGSTSSTAAQGNDSRLSDARTPTTHAASHAAGGTDPVTLTEAQITSLVSDLAAKQASGNYLTTITGDLSANGPGAAAGTLATVNGSPGTTGDASHTSQVTTDGKGRTTTNTSVAIAIAAGAVSGLAPSATTDATNANNIASGTLAAARGGAGTISGALRGSGSGVVTQAACADLSNASVMCSSAAYSSLTGKPQLANAITATTSNWVNSYDPTTGNFTKSQPADADIAFTDVTTGNASTSQHGYLLKLGGGTVNFLRADGSWAAPPAAGATTSLNNLASVAINADLVTGAGTPAKFTATAPAQTSASQAGTPVTVTPSDATDGSATHGAVAGGYFNVFLGAGKNGGALGQMNIIASTPSSSTVPLLGLGCSGANNLCAVGFGVKDGGVSFIATTLNAEINNAGLFLKSGMQIAISSNSDPANSTTRLHSSGTKSWGLGDPADTASVQDYLFGGIIAVGTNVPGSKTTFHSGFGSGNGAPGVLCFQTGFPGASGTTGQPGADRKCSFGPKTLTESSPTPVVTSIGVASGTITGGTFSYTIEANDGTDFQSHRGVVQFSVYNKGGTVGTVTDNTTAGVPASQSTCSCSSGTLTETVTWTTGTNTITPNITAVSSLTQTVLRVTGQIELDGGTGVITP